MGKLMYESFKARSTSLDFQFLIGDLLKTGNLNKLIV